MSFDDRLRDQLQAHEPRARTSSPRAPKQSALARADVHPPTDAGATTMAALVRCTRSRERGSLGRSDGQQANLATQGETAGRRRDRGRRECDGTRLIHHRRPMFPTPRARSIEPCRNLGAALDPVADRHRRRARWLQRVVRRTVERALLRAVDSAGGHLGEQPATSSCATTRSTRSTDRRWSQHVGQEIATSAPSTADSVRVAVHGEHRLLRRAAASNWGLRRTPGETGSGRNST